MASKRLNKRTITKKAKAKTHTTTTTDVLPGTLEELTQHFLADLERSGKSDSTRRGYGSDLKIAMRVLGSATKVADITERELARFDASKPVTRTKAGKLKASPGVDRMRRTIRMALRWASQR